jgi:hypothetical protein
MKMAPISKLGLLFLGLGCALTSNSSSQDTSPPSAPTGVSVIAVTTTSVSLAWNASTDDVGVIGYDVYAGGSRAVSTAAVSATVSGLAAATSYSFIVRARDRAGNASSGSEAVIGTTSASGSTPNPGSDFESDAGPDTGSNTRPDAGLDAGPDAAFDANLDAGPDAAFDANLDAGPDAAFDADPDAGSDAGADAGFEADASRHQEPYPLADASTCGSLGLTENVCCARYCAGDDRSEGCASCGGESSPSCVTVNAKACKSGEWSEVHGVSADEPWHFSRSTHFGLTPGGACGFGLYGLCNTKFNFSDSSLAEACDAFCKAYPALCMDPASTTLRGNFAAPQGNYYTQFWASLPGGRDNYLSCGECFELVRTRKDGSDYQPGEAGYTPPITLQVVDSCPCSANSKWCCGSGRDHCGEVSDFKYGCQLPPAPPNPAADHDPLPGESIHLDLSDIAMARLQTGDPNGAMVDGVIPTRYRRVPCPVVGNVYVWLRSNAGPYWFSLSVVNAAALGSVVKVEAQLPSGAWVALQRDQSYTSSRPQERYGAWVLPQDAGPFALPLSLRFTDPSGRALVADGAIKAWEPSDASMSETYYIDTGLQF